MRVQYMRSETGTTIEDGHERFRINAKQKTQSELGKRTDRIVRPITRINGSRIHFKDLAVMAWPAKAEANLSYLLHVDPRTCRRWLAGETEPSAEALGVILAEIMKRFHQRD
jgi:hypothetical protein